MPCDASLGDHTQPCFEFCQDTIVRSRRGRSIRNIGDLSAADAPRLGSLMDFGKLAHRNQVIRRSVEHTEELGTRLLVATQFEEGAPEGHPRRQVGGVLGQADLTHLDRFLAVTGTAVLLRELRKSNRRRVLLNPASKILNPRVIRHA